MNKINLYYNKGQHVSRLITGFHMLEEQNMLQVNFVENKDNFRGTLHPQIVEAEIGSKLLAFDMCDAFSLGNDRGHRYLDKVDAYFKRSYSTKLEESDPPNWKISPKFVRLDLIIMQHIKEALLTINPRDYARQPNVL